MKPQVLYLIVYLIGLGNCIHIASAQQLTQLPTAPDSFIVSLTQKLEKSPDVEKKLANSFLLLWQDGSIAESDKPIFIEHINSMVGKKYGLDAEIALYVSTWIDVIQSGKRASGALPVKKGETLNKSVVESGNFLEVSDKCINSLNRIQLRAFWKSVSEYLGKGYLRQVQRFSWLATQSSPKLEMRSLMKEGVQILSPVMVFNDTDLLLTSDTDSCIIYKTQGFVDLLTRTFHGQGGLYDWSQVNLDPQDVYCNFFNYQLNLDRAQIQADSVEFYYESLFDKPLLGKFEDRNLSSRDTSSRFPLFESYSGSIVIDDLIANAVYTGGFSMMGNQKVGSSYDAWIARKSGDPEQVNDEFGGNLSGDWIRQHIRSKLVISRNNNRVMTLEGESFLLDKKYARGRNISATIFMTDVDSIYHPGLDFSFAVDEHLIVFKKPRKGTYSHIPFLSSYHDFFMYFEALIWDIETDVIRMTAMLDKENKTAAIESYDYFTEKRFSQFKNILEFNPLGAIYKYVSTNKESRVFPDKVLGSYAARFNSQDMQEVFLHNLPFLEGSGFIKYDKVTFEIFPQPKLFNWVKAARGKKDFDALQIVSRADTGDFATIDLTKQELSMQGVPYFAFSDSQYVRVLPLDNKVLATKNRELKFGGTIAAGKLNFYSNKVQDFRFDYENFRIDCNTIDSMRFVLVRNAPDGYSYSPLEKALSNTVFENVNGALYIDAPDNKSGKERLKYYPVFDSYKNSSVYWNDSHIQGGVYAKEKLYFSVFPFVLDSLETFDEKALLFAGDFFSSNVFPTLNDTLTLMPDFTLGFSKFTPTEGYNIYNYKGKFYNKIILDGSGLHGKGRLEHDGIIVGSDSVIFHPDSVMAIVDSFNLEQGFRKGKYFPQLDGTKARYTWYPEQGRVVFQTPQEEKDENGKPTGPPITVFDGEAKFYGKMEISKEGLIGNGRLLVGEVEIDGTNIMLREKDFEATNATFAIIDTVNPNVKYFSAGSVSVKYDVLGHKATFKPLPSVQDPAAFPTHNYLTTLNKGDYKRETREIILEAVSPKPEENYFITSHDAGDSLNFSAEQALFNIDQQTIQISGVPYVRIADAVITPETYALTVEKAGAIKQIDKATIEVGKQQSKNHRIYDAHVQIISGKSYKGSGKYDYIDVEVTEKGKKEQFIDFNEISVLNRKTSYATGKISESREFYITDRILFRGDAVLEGSQKFLRFEGEVKIEADNPVFQEEWFTFKRSFVNPDSVFIPIPENITNNAGEKLTVGLYFMPLTQNYYSTFLQPQENSDDKPILTTSGGLTVDRKTKEFRIGPESKFKNRTYKGTTVSYDDRNNIITSKGYLNFPFNFLNKTMTVKMVGAWKEDIEKDFISTNLMMGINMEVIPADQLRKIYDNFLFLTTNSKDLDYQERIRLENIAELLDENSKEDKATRNFIKQLNSAMVYTDINLAELLPFTILLTDLNLHYAGEDRVLYSDSEVGVVGINSLPVNKIINGKTLYQPGQVVNGEPQSDELTIYLEIDDYNWVYFHYAGEVVSTLSSYQDDYNLPLQAALEKRKSNNGYRFELASDEEVRKFKQQIKAYSGKK